MTTQKYSVLAFCFAIGIFLNGCGGGGSDSGSGDTSSSSSSSSADYEAVVTFPVAGSNIGGYATGIHVRGHITRNGAPEPDPADELEISVNGETATFADDGSGNWIVEVPLAAGDNTLNIEVAQSGDVLFTDTASVANSPVIRPDTVVSDSGTSIYGIDVEAGHILTTAIATGEQETLLSLEDVAETTDCQSFDTISLSNNGDKLAVACSQAAGEDDVIVLISLSDSTTSAFELNFQIPLNAAVEWVDNKHLLFNGHRTDAWEFSLLTFSDRSIKDFIVEYNDSGGGYLMSRNLFVNDLQVYVDALSDSIDRNPVWTYFDLTEVITETGDPINPIVAADAGRAFHFTGSISAVGGDAYYSDSQQLFHWELNTNPPGGIPLDPAIGPIGMEESLTIVYHGADYIVARYSNSRQLYRIDLTTGDTAAINDAPGLARGRDFSINPEDSQLISYGFVNHRMARVDLESYEVVETRVLTDDLYYTSSLHEHMRYDWQNQLMYRNRIVDWEGVAPSDDPLVLRYDVASENDEPVLTGNELDSHLGDGSSAAYRVGEVTFSGDEDVLWFTALSFLDDDTSVEGVYTLNLKSDMITTLYEETHQAGVTPVDDPYLSGYYPELNGVLMTEWRGGYLKILDNTGSVQELVPNNTPYLTTHGARFDSDRNVVYFEGYYGGTTPGFIDNRTVEIVEYDRDGTGTQVVASNDIGQGVTLGWTNQEYSQSRQLLYSHLHGHLLIIDPYSGDRVLKEL